MVAWTPTIFSWRKIHFMAEQIADRWVVTISRRGAERIRAGHVWVYRSDVVDAKDVPPGSVVTVTEQADKSVRPTRPLQGTNKSVALRGGRGRPPRTRILGMAFYSSASEIALRMISRVPVADIHQLVRERVRAAIAYRERFVRDTNAYRVVFSEGDFLPGLMVDRYNDLLSVQVLTQAMDTVPMRETVLSDLKMALRPRAIVERMDARVRKLEQLEERGSGVVWQDVVEPRSFENSNAHVGAGALTPPAPLRAAIGEQGSPGRVGAPVPTQVDAIRGAQTLNTEFQMNGVRFLFDALGGQKTGAFLDQRENYGAAVQYARGEALDVFCYQGGFALHLAEKCEKVSGVDSSRPALEIAERNAALNRREIEWIEANAFDLLRDYSDAGKKYDCIVLDPPPFAKSRRDLPTALRGYKELNLRALKMLQPDGILVTCSCSYHVSATDLVGVVASAGQDSHRIIRILENRGQSKDHPNVVGIPETAYLKCLILAVS
jgi:23S rRNA (cytosine1962-C5)-methyltransferase